LTKSHPRLAVAEGKNVHSSSFLAQSQNGLLRASAAGKLLLPLFSFFIRDFGK
jgi:hypothetical protein